MAGHVLLCIISAAIAKLQGRKGLSLDEISPAWDENNGGFDVIHRIQMDRRSRIGGGMIPKELVSSKQAMLIGFKKDGRLGQQRAARQ